MKVTNKLLDILQCPRTGSSLSYVMNSAVEDTDGSFLSDDGGNRYFIRSGVARFVDEDNYANNFGTQWNHFSKTQLDSYSGHPISKDRFWSATNWVPEDLEGKWILDAGCGAGRFAEIALDAGANVVAIDYSSAVDACWNNLSYNPKLHVLQADLYALPFKDAVFDYVYSLGVLQHTPNVEQAFKALPRVLKPGGKICVDYYWKRIRTMFHAKYAFRPITTRMSQQRLFELLQRHTPTMLKTSQILGKLPLAGRVLKRIVPVADYTGRFPLSDMQLKEWALLDTFDMLAPTYDNPQTQTKIAAWMSESGIDDVEVLHASHLVARGAKPALSK